MLCRFSGNSSWAVVVTREHLLDSLSLQWVPQQQAHCSSAESLWTLCPSDLSPKDYSRNSATETTSRIRGFFTSPPTARAKSSRKDSNHSVHLSKSFMRIARYPMEQEQ